MSYAEPASQRELTDGRGRRVSRRAVPTDCQSTRHDADDWDFNPFAVDRATTLTATRALLDADEVAASIVAATISTVQSTRESRPAFVKRIVKAWLDEMERGQ